jgi:hypothetical protein
MAHCRGFIKFAHLFIGRPAKNINKIKPIKQVKPVLRAPAGSEKNREKKRRVLLPG